MTPRVYRRAAHLRAARSHKAHERTAATVPACALCAAAVRTTRDGTSLRRARALRTHAPCARGAIHA